MKFFLKILLIIALLSTSSAFAADYYVSNIGDDINNGDALTPWQTLQHAVDSIDPGDRIIVTTGVYAGFRISISGDADNYCTIQAETGGIVEINTPSQNAMHNAIVEFNTNTGYWNIEGLQIVNTSDCAIYMDFTTNVNFTKLKITESLCGIFIKDSENIFVQTSYIADNTGYSLEIENSKNIKILNSLMINNKAEAVFYNDCSSFTFANNTIFNDSSTTPMFDFSSLNNDLKFINNIVISQVQDVALLTFNDLDDFEIHNNIYKGKFKIHDASGLLDLDEYKSLSNDENSFTIDPENIFTDYHNQDFSLQNNSSAGELGVFYDEIYGVSEDFAGNQRVQGYFPEPGAFESADSVNSDTDSDGLPNWWENLRGLDFLDSATPDEDDDLDDLINSDEYARGTLPKYGDSDADGFGDGDEVTAGTDPLDKYDFPDQIGVTPATFDNLQVRKWFKYTYEVVNNKKSYRFEVIDGTIPPGLVFYEAKGILSGYPARPGNFDFEIKVTDSEDRTDTQKVRIYVGIPENSEPSSGCNFSPENSGADFYFVMLFLTMLVFTRIARINSKR